MSDPDDFSSGSSDLWRPSNLSPEETNVDSSAETGQLLESSLSNDDVPLSEAVIIKRKKGHGSMQRSLRKERSDKRVKGEAYITRTGKRIPVRTPNSLSETCRAKCQQKVETINLMKVYEDYRNLPNRDTQKRYLAGLIIIKP